MSDLALQLESVGKAYRGFALQEVCFELPRGYIMGLIGANWLVLLRHLQQCSSCSSLCWQPFRTCVWWSRSSPSRALSKRRPLNSASCIPSLWSPSAAPS